VELLKIIPQYFLTISGQKAVIPILVSFAFISIVSMNEYCFLNIYFDNFIITAILKKNCRKRVQKQNILRKNSIENFCSKCHEMHSQQFWHCQLCSNCYKFLILWWGPLKGWFPGVTPQYFLTISKQKHSQQFRYH